MSSDILSEILFYGDAHSNSFLQFHLNLKRWKFQKSARHPTIWDVINDVKLFPTVSQDILSQIFDVIQSDVALQKQVH